MPISTSSHQNNDDDDISDAVLHGKVPSERLFQPHKPTNRHAASAKQASLRYLRLTDEFRGGSRDGLRGKHGVHKARPDSWPSKELPSSCRVLDGVTPRTARAPSAPSRPLAPGRGGGAGRAHLLELVGAIAAASCSHRDPAETKSATWPPQNSHYHQHLTKTAGGAQT